MSSDPMATPFGPSALATPANLVTVGRLLVSPFLLYLILGASEPWAALALWIFLCGTDGLDGYLARRQGVTRSGAFLDPLADKVLVLGAMVALVIDGPYSVLPVALIGARELGVSLFRTYWGRRGRAVPATYWAKVKTVVQEVAVGFALLPATADDRWITDGALWIAVALTLVTGMHYIQLGSRSTRATGCA